jgi:hypothetical protein
MPKKKPRRTRAGRRVFSGGIMALCNCNATAMSTFEHHVQQRILLACGSGDARLWRNNVGTGWAGQATRITAGNVRAVASQLRPGDVVIRGGRPLHAGLCVGSSDLIGYRSLVVGAEHVGQRLAVFAAVEVKTERGRASAEQTRFLNHIEQAGGKAGIARSVDDAHRILRSNTADATATV